MDIWLINLILFRPARPTRSSTATESSSVCTSGKVIPVDEDGRIKPYVDFRPFYELWKQEVEPESKGHSEKSRRQDSVSLGRNDSPSSEWLGTHPSIWRWQIYVSARKGEAYHATNRMVFMLTLQVANLWKNEQQYWIQRCVICQWSYRRVRGSGQRKQYPSPFQNFGCGRQIWAFL